MSENLAPQTPRSDDRPLDDVMLAMDVVDTLRHRASLVEKELNADDRDRQLIERLRALYAAQGIDVPDRVLAEGVDALREDRFTYEPPKSSFQVKLAHRYVTRRIWGPWLLGMIGLLATSWIGYWLLVSAPRARHLRDMPGRLVEAEQVIVGESKSPEATALATRISKDGQAAVEDGDIGAAKEAIQELKDLRARLDQEYELRIVTQGSTGIWRIPDVNSEARNYYIIVQAVVPDGQRLTLPITDEEDGKVHHVDKWGLRVDEETFRKIETDKKDDGIIQGNCFGVKRPGYLDPEYRMPMSGGAITSW